MTQLLSRRIAMLLMLSGLSASVLAQVPATRNFPANTKRGVLDMSAYPDVMMDKKIRNTAPGLRIFTTENLMVTVGSMNASNIVVNYTESNYGDIEKIWILTQAEIDKVLPPVEVWKPVPFKNP